MIDFQGIYNLPNPKNEDIKILIKLEPFLIKLNNVKNQRILLPIVNHFFKIQIDIKLGKKYSNSIEIPIPDIMSGAIENKITDFILDSNLKKQNKENQENLPFIKLRFRNYSTYSSYWAEGCPFYLDGEEANPSKFKLLRNYDKP
jgi:hypothetical protein